jgi:YVTN family beta-propeller protein
MDRQAGGGHVGQLIKMTVRIMVKAVARTLIKVAGAVAVVAIGSAIAGGCSPGASGGSPRAGGHATTVEQRAALVAATADRARWSSVMTLPLVPTAAANLPDGKVLLWSADDRFNFGVDTGKTYTVVFDPQTGTATERLVTETGHDMFCPGTANLADGRILVNGGLSSATTSIYDPTTGGWTRAADMNIPRAYEGTTPLADGSVFTLGGSWAGGVGNKHGELWTEAAGWRRMPGVLIDAFLSVDDTRVFGMDSHLWLLPAGNGRIFHAGPGINMNWVDTVGDGRVTAIGRRGDDQFSINGNVVMYDIGKVLKICGAPGYDGVTANSNAYVIDLGATVEVRKIQSLAYQRAFENAVVLPNGQVVVIGGATVAVGFSDNNAVLAPELFDPDSETFVVLPPMSVPRNYHSVALLLPDARVISAGGGLCGAGCAANHPDLQILSPPYLFNADGSAATRPVIRSAPAVASHGTTITVTTDGPVAAFAMVRSSSNTHAINNDQRRLPLSFRATATNVYAVDIPSNPGWALPGLYMLFALNDAGVPSVATIVRVGSATPLRLAPVRDQSTLVGAAARVTLVGTSPIGAALTYAATDLPPGLTLDPVAGIITGAATAIGRSLIDVSVSDGSQTTSTQFVWAVGDSAGDGGAVAEGGVGADGSARFVMLEGDSEVNGGPWSSAAEINLLDENGQTVSRAGWTATADSVELSGENGAVSNAIDGNPDTIWHTQWQAASPPPPHWIKIDLGSAVRLSGLRYLPRQDSGPNGTIARYRVLLSNDGVTWGDPVSRGDFTQIGALHDEKIVFFGDVSAGLPAPIVSPIAAPIVARGTVVSYTAVAAGIGPFQYQWTFADGSEGGGFTSAPTVSHTFATVGAFNVTLTVRNTDGAAGVRQFLQGVSAPAVPGAPRASSNVALEVRAGQSARAWVVNIDNDSVSVFDTATNAKVAEIAVGNQPRTVAVAPNGAVWVTNKGSSTLSVIDPGTLTVTRTVTLPRGAQPFGVVVGVDGNALVTLEAAGRVVKIDGTGASIEPLATLDVGPNPRHLALAPSGGAAGGASPQLLVSRFITPPQPGEETATVQTSLGGITQGGQVLVVDPAAFTLTRTITLQHSDRPDTTVSGRGVPNYLGAPAIAPDGQSAWVPAKQDNIQRGHLRDQHELDFQNTVRAISARIDLVAQAEDYPARLDHDNAGLASAAVYHPTGVYLFVALESSRQIAVVDASGRRELFRVDAGRAPQGLVVADDGLTLYVHNALDRTLGVYDLVPLIARGEVTLPLVATVASVAIERLAPPVLRGKQLFYDARDTRLARDSYLSCAVCHNDGGFDGRTWDLTGLGEGLRNTINLRGRAGGQGRLHWSANFDEVQDFEGQIRSLASGTGLMSDADFAAGTRSQPLGDTKAGVSADLDALAAYLGSLSTFAPSPYRDAAGAPTTDAVAGRVVFAGSCATCHGGDAFTDSAALTPHDVGTIKASSGSRLGGPLAGIDTPTLRDAWATAPYLHDGSASTLEAAISAHTNLSLSAGDLASVAAFTRQIGGDEPAVTATGAPAGGAPGADGLQGAYFNNLTLAGSAVLTRSEAVDFDWGYGVPAPGLPADNFSVRWTGRVSAPSSGNYLFQTLSDDGVRLWVNGTLVIDNWSDHGPTTNNTAPIALAAGQSCDIKLEYYERTGGAVIRLSWQTPDSAAFVVVPAAAPAPGAPPGSPPSAAGTGLLGQYFSNNALSGTPTLSRSEAVDFDWGYGVAAPGLPADNFSVRWTGQVNAPSSGDYVFQTLSDDGVRLWVNGTLSIDNWTDHGPTTDNAPAITLAAGQRYDIKLEYYERGGGAVVRFNWLTPGAAVASAVPRDQLYGN